MPTLADQLLSAAAKDLTGLARAAAGDHLEEVGRTAEAERLRQPGRVIYRYTDGRWWIDLRPEPLRTYRGLRRPVRGTRDDAAILVQRVTHDSPGVVLRPELEGPGWSMEETRWWWGGDRPGCAHLARALLRDLVGGDVVEAVYSEYARRHLVPLDVDSWLIDEEVIWLRFDAIEFALWIGAFAPMPVSLQEEAHD